MAKKKIVKKNEEVGGIDNLDVIKKAITKKYGNVISKLSDHEDMIIPTVSTGSLSLDLALGRGGMALGRVYEIFGPNSGGKSTLAANVVIQAQKRGLKCCYVDAEHAVDPVLFKNYGVNIKDLDLVQGFNGEENLDILEMLVQSGSYKVAVVDSVSSLIPSAEAEAEIGNDFIALLARLMSKALRRLTPIANRSGCLLIFINQLRNKIGSYGCFHYDTLVNFVDGRSLSIGEVVGNKINGDVWTFNEDTNEFEANPITGWHDNGLVDIHKDFIHIQTDSINGRGRFGFTCTTNHKILTKYGWKKVSELAYSDKLISKYEETVNGTYGEFLSGCLVGDSHISIRHKNTAALKLQDNNNIEYINWKLDKVSSFINFTETMVSRGYRYDSEYTYELSKIKGDIGNRNPMYFLNNYSDLGFAIWIMDDGNLDLNNGHRRYGLSIKRLKNNIEALDEIRNKFIELGFDCNYRVNSGFFQFDTTSTDVIANVIYKYVPECMSYKLPIEYRDKYEDFILHNKSKTVADYVDIKEIRYASDRQMRKKHKFDISVGRNHNYMVGGKHNGVVVHNSPEITTGGEALGFYTTGRISIRGPESKKRRIPDPITGEVIGHETLFEITKNKLAPPFKKSSINLIYGSGYDFHWEVLTMATELGIIDKTGAWYSYNGDNFAQGELNASIFLKENDEIYNEVRNKVIDMLGLKELYERHCR